MNHQDWETVVLKKDKPKEKVSYQGSQSDKPLKKISHDFKISLQKSRQSHKLSQKQLAQKINVSESLIKEYESGKAIPNGNIINKLNRVLGIKLPPCKRKT